MWDLLRISYPEQGSSLCVLRRLLPAHGGTDPGAVYRGRQEKDDNLELTLEVGKILEENGIDVVYTRTTDVYQTPFEKARLANESGADYFISFHRNSSPSDNQYEGVEVLVYDKNGIKYDMAENIVGALGELGFRELGVKERPGACGPSQNKNAGPSCGNRIYKF